jgi:hypothetical protein
MAADLVAKEDAKLAKKIEDAKTAKTPEEKAEDEKEKTCQEAKKKPLDPVE